MSLYNFMHWPMRAPARDDDDDDDEGLTPTQSDDADRRTDRQTNG